MFSVKLCKEYLTMATFKISVFLLIKSRTFLYADRLFTSSHTGVVHFLKMYGFYWLPIIWYYCHCSLKQLIGYHTC